MKKLLDEYVYDSLKKYKNTVITYEEYNKLGEKKILENLKAWGFDCEIDIRLLRYDPNRTQPSEYMEDIDVIISVK